MAYIIIHHYDTHTVAYGTHITYASARRHQQQLQQTYPNHTITVTQLLPKNLPPQLTPPAGT